jgi:hypothetical protein
LQGVRFTIARHQFVTPRGTLPDLLSRLLDQSCTDRELSCLIQWSINVGKAIVRTSFQRKSLLLEQAGYSSEDCVVIAIEDLFVARDGIRAFELVRFFRTEYQERSVLHDDECLSSLRRVIYRKLRQTMAEIAGEVDGVYRKVLRNIQDLLNGQATSMHTVEWFNDDLVFHASFADRLELQRQEMPFEELLSLLMAEARQDMTTEDLVELLLSIVERFDTCRKAMSRTTLAALLREYYLVRAHSGILFESTTSMDTLSFQVRDAMRRSIAHIRETMLASEQEAAGYIQAMASMLEDILAQHARRMFDYYQESFPGIGYDEYRRNGRHRFEYIMQKTKEHFFAECLRLVSPEGRAE